MEAIKPILKRHGCALWLSDEPVQLGERYYIRATATVCDIETGETIQNTAYAREDAEKKGMDGSQITGTSSSYARKYALNGLFCIDDTKDADTEEFKRQKDAEVKLTCARCQKPIKGIAYQGKRYTAEEVSQKWGLCPDCFKEAAQAHTLAELNGDCLTFGGGE